MPPKQKQAWEKPKIYKLTCEACHKEWYVGSIRECCLKPGHYICIFCCKKCKRHYEKAYTGAQGCRAWDRKMEKEKEEARKA